MKKRILILLGILIIGGGAAAGVCWKMGVFGQQETSGDSVYVTKISDLTGQTSGVSNRYAGVVEPQETVSVELESGRTVKEVQVKTGDQVKKGQLLFEYDLSSIQESLEEAQLDLDRLKNEASSLNERIATLEKEKKKASDLFDRKSDICIDTIGSNQTITQCLDYIKETGTIAVYGLKSGENLNVPLPELRNFNIQYVQWPVPEVEAEVHKPVCDAIMDGKIDIDLFVTHRFSIDDYEKGFQAVKDRTALKVVLNF